VGVPLRPVSATPAPVAGKELSASAKVRQRTKTSSLTVIAASAGVGMVILAGAIVLVILSQKSDDRGRKTYGSSVQDRPIVHVPSSPRETFHRPTPPPRQPRPVERKPRLFGARSEAGNDASDAALSAAIGPGLPVPVAEPSPPSTGQVQERVEVLTEPTFSAPSGKPPVGSPPAGMAEAKSPTDSSLSLPAFPAGPTLPSTDTAAAPQPNPTAPSESPAVPPQPKEAMPDETPPQSPPQPPPSEFKPALSNTKPEPPKPAEATSGSPAVKPAEVAALATALKAAHAAILNREYDAAAAELNQAEALPKSPEDHAKYERLTLLAGYAKNFRSALKSAVAGLHPGDEIEIGGSTVVGFVSAAKDSITLRVTGANRTYALDSLPAGLAVAIADRWLKKDDPLSLAMKGAYVAALKDVDEERKARARQWLEEASKKGVEGELHKVLDDTYDSEPAGK
jgi:hypothetical protein